MLTHLPAQFTPDLGRTLTEEERRELEPLYTWPRPERKNCQRESNNDKYRMGRR